MHPLFIYCAGGFGQEVMDVARRRNSSTPTWSEIHFLDDVCETSTRYGARVFTFGQALDWMSMHGGEVVIANGEPAAKQAICTRLEVHNIALGTVVDASTIVANTAHVSPGTIVAPMCSISSNVFLEKNVSINTMSIIGHDAHIDQNTVISSKVSVGGHSRIGRNTYIGMGALIKDGLNIGQDVIIGMGSVVHNDIPDGMIALGNPARPVRRNEDKRVFK
jgi:sugar O-acyltransferase (sialic acid O-acetyltransferase NeuD family)